MVGGSSSQTNPTYAQLMIPKDLKDLRGQISPFLANQLNSKGQTYGNTPEGPLNSVYQNLFGDNPTGDFLGARQTIESNLSGRGFQNAANATYQGMLPGVMNSIMLGGNALRETAGANGMRFSTDLMNNQRALANSQLLGLQQNAIGNANTYMQNTGNQAQGIYSLIGDLGMKTIANQLPLLLQYASQFPPSGQFGGGGSSSNFQFL